MSSRFSVAEVKEKADIVQLIGRTVELRQRGQYFVGLCPFHQEKTPSFYVRPKIKRFKCFGCGASGDAIEFLMRLRGQTFADALSSLALEVGIEPAGKNEATAQSNAERENDRLLRVQRLIQSFFQEQLVKAGEASAPQRYLLEKRRLTKAMIKQAGLGYGASSEGPFFQFLKKHHIDMRDAETLGLVSCQTGRNFGLFTHRITIPIRASSGEVIAFGGRLLEDLAQGRPKYINSRSHSLFEKSRTLFGAYESRLAQNQGLFLVEGYFDAMALWAVGIPAVSACGTALTEHHVQLIRRLSKKLILFLDNDAAGKRAIYQILPLLLKNELEIGLVISDLKDAACFQEQDRLAELKKLCEKPTDALSHMIRASAAQIGADVRDRVLAIEQMMPLFSAIPQKITQRQYVRFFARSINEDEQLLLQEVSKKKPKATVGSSKESSLKKAKNSIQPLNPTEKLILQALLSKPSLMFKILKLENIRGISSLLVNFLHEFSAFGAEPIEVALNQFITDAKKEYPAIVAELRRIHSQRLFLKPEEAEKVVNALERDSEEKELKERIKAQRMNLLQAEKNGDRDQLFKHLKGQSSLILGLSQLRGRKHMDAPPKESEMPKVSERASEDEKKAKKNNALNEDAEGFFEEGSGWDQ